jgi:hypothetical protein
MRDLDGCGWAGGVAFVSYGVRVGIRVEDVTLLNELPACLPPRWRPTASPVVDYLYSLRVERPPAAVGVAPLYTLWAGPWPVSRTRERREALDGLRANIEGLVAERARRWLFVHAGVVGWQGRALVVPGRSGCGKTTLVAALVRAGAVYYSDEYAVLDRHGRVHPYPRPLRVRLPGTPGARDLPVEALGGHPGRRALPLGLLAATAYRPGARWRPRVLSPGEAVLALLANTVAAREALGALPVLGRAVGAARGLRGWRGEADEATRALLAAVEPRGPAPPS